MEKISVKEKNIVNLLTTKKAKYVIGTILMSMLGITLPRIFHLIAGTSAGATFLPMHIAILLSALTFGMIPSVIVASCSVVFSYLLTGMPTIARMPYMMIELIIYGVLLSLFNKKYNSCVSLILTIVLGRVIYAGVLFAAANILNLSLYGISVIESVKMGIPGLIIQIALVPIIAKLMNDRLKLND